MRIEELIKEASDIKDGARVKHRTDIHASDGYMIANTRAFNDAPSDVDVANARLIAHCLNNFMPMVEALELADRMLRTQGVICFKAEQALESAKEVQDA